MLATHDQELLTAYIDGELSARQRRAVERLLRRSGEARLLLRQLQEDARQLQSIPVPALGVDLSASVLEAINRRRLKPIRRAPLLPAPRAFPMWTGVAAAAAVLLLVGLGSFLQSSRGPSRSVHELPKRHETPEGAVRPIEQPVAKAAGKEKEKELPRAVDHKEKAPEREQPPVIVRGEKEKPAPGKENLEPRDPPLSVLFSGEKEAPGKLEQVELALPVLHKLHDLDQAGPGAKLLDQLGKGSAFRIELLCKDASRGFNRIQSAFAAQKIPLVLEPTAQARLKKPQYKTDYALFFENLTPADLVKLLANVGRLDRSPSSDKKPAEIRFDGTVVVQKMSKLDCQDLASLLGVDPIHSRPEAPTAPPKIDIRQPLTENTRAAVDAALEGKGVPRPTGAGNSAVVVTMPNPNRNRTPEVKRFLDGRRPALPQTVQVFLVLRNIGS